MKTAWKTAGKILLFLGGGFIAVFANFAIFGFPFPTESSPNIFLVELAVLVALLGIPLFR
ncbi:MAG TPA: hypothetical protein GX528_00585 [Firmicutes bacterium]|nr:hypothetical protein [Bacillota bacterium]